jgi:hypothetical protein
MAKKRLPKVGDRVSLSEYPGAFVVSVVYENHTALVAKIGTPDTRYMVEWSKLAFLDELDESQNALRVVREATEGK